LGFEFTLTLITSFCRLWTIVGN